MASHWFDLPEENFNELLRLARMYYREARRCADAKAYLAGCVMAGASLEGLLMSMLHLYGKELDERVVPVSHGKPKPLLKWTLYEMIRAARTAEWLPAGLELGAEWNGRRAKIGDYAEALRQIRNLVHAPRYLQDHSPSRITKRYLLSSLEILDVARSYLEAKVHESLRKAMKEEEEEASRPRPGPDI